MSMTQTEISLTARSSPEDDEAMATREELSCLERYLAIIENNRKANVFVPDDALLALDMANAVRSTLDPAAYRSPISSGRLAMALIQPAWTGPVQ